MRRSTEFESSWVTFRETTYLARYAPGGVPGRPHSSLTQLVQGVWEREPGMARAILRRRIHTTGPLTPLERGMVKTAAQRVSVADAEPALAGPVLVSFENRYAAPELSEWQDALAPMALARALAASVRRGELRASDRPVGCVLVGADGRRLAWAHNTNAANRTLHAEVNLAQAWWTRHGSGFPPGAALHTTLEPCRMCQGMLAACLPDLHVLYAAGDGMPRVAESLRLEADSSGA